jgi:hypothetical protein
MFVPFVLKVHYQGTDVSFHCLTFSSLLVVGSKIKKLLNCFAKLEAHC